MPKLNKVNQRKREESADDNDFFIDDEIGPRVEQRTKKKHGNPHDTTENIYPLWITAECVEMLLESEACVTDKFAGVMNQDPEARRMYNLHTQLVDELTHIRNHTNPS